jgi:hypothetical protein
MMLGAEDNWARVSEHALLFLDCIVKGLLSFNVAALSLSQILDLPDSICNSSPFWQIESTLTMTFGYDGSIFLCKIAH